MTFKIERIVTHGIMSVYRRCWNTAPEPKFLVIRETDGKVLENFRLQRSAEKWAKENSKG